LIGKLLINAETGQVPSGARPVHSAPLGSLFLIDVLFLAEATDRAGQSGCEYREASARILAFIRRCVQTRCVALPLTTHEAKSIIAYRRTYPDSNADYAQSTLGAKPWLA